MSITESQARALGPQLRRELRDCDVTCPAGSCVNGRAVFCGIEKQLIDSADQPTTVMVYCAGDHTLCSTWRAEKERIWAAKREGLVEE